MSTPSDLQHLDTTALHRYFDEGSIRRGMAYHREHRVELFSVEPGEIVARCTGSAGHVYEVDISWDLLRGSLRLYDSCSCPLGGGCKHCVATIFTALDHDDAGTVPAGGSRGDPHWRRNLADLPVDDSGELDGVESGYTRIALLVAVTAPRLTRFQPVSAPVPTVRPMRLGASGKWIKTGASWADLTSTYSYHRAVVEPHQLAVLHSLMASGRFTPYSTGNTATPLTSFGPDLWYHLSRAVEVGIELVSDRNDLKVELSATDANATIDLAASDDGAVTMSVAFDAGDGPLRWSDETAGLLGRPPHGLWLLDGGVLRLVPLATRLHPSLARLISAPAMTVPADDVDELLDVYVPALARHASVGSSDGSVTITTTEFDRLVLAVERTAVDRATARWFVQYRRGERTTRHPLHRPAGAGRNREAEAEAVRALRLPDDLAETLTDPADNLRDVTVRGADLVALLTEVAPWLEENTEVTVEVTGDLPALQASSSDPLISLSVVDGDADRAGNDWFDLQVEVRVDDHVVDFATLFTALNLGDEILVLPSGSWIRLDQPELTRLRELIVEARGLADPTGSAVARLNRFQVSWWEELAGLGVVAEQSERWAASLERMGELRAPTPIEPPAGLAAELRHYQQVGLDWLAFLHHNQLGGILADDMGLGKTVQAIALFLHVLEADPTARFLVVAPTSVVENWAREAARFAPGVAVHTIRETAARRGAALRDEVGDARIVVTSYALFRIDFDDYDALDWSTLVLDEAQFVKNHQGKTYQCVRRLDAPTKLAVTGTPLENSLMDLWALLSITAPGLFPDPKRFSETYRRPIERGTSPELLATLRRRIAPLMRRRTKDEVLTELPPKTEQTVEVELNARHARIYQTQLQRQRQKVLGLVGDVQRHRFEIFRSLTLLRQLALDPALVDDEHEHVGSAKLDRLMEDLVQVVAEGHRALVFSQFTRYLARVRTRLDAHGIAYSYLDGRTRNREKAISSFKDGDNPVFVISLKAGGFGLNLTEADYCFVLDPWWNPAVESQAVDRTHRIGQLNPVMVYRYVSLHTIEEKVMELKARKADLFANVIDAEGALAGALTEDDILGLLDLA